MIISTVYRIILIFDVTSNTKDRMQLVPVPPRHFNDEKKKENEGANSKALPIFGEARKKVFLVVHFSKQPVAVFGNTLQTSHGFTYIFTFFCDGKR